MIANITRGDNPGNIGAYLHGPGTANEHTFQHQGKTYSGGVVIGGNLHLNGELTPKAWVKEMRAAMRTRPEIKNPIWHVSLRNTANDRILSNAEWADAGQTFAERMGFENHPWTMVRHGADHVHIVVSRINDAGEVWHGRHDRRNAQRACAELERTYGLEKAPRRRQQAAKQSVTAEREHFRAKQAQLAADRIKLEEWRSVRKRMGLMSTKGPIPGPHRGQNVQKHTVRVPQHFRRGRGRDQGLER